ALRSCGTVELLVAIYRVIKPALLEAYRTHNERTNPLVDHPTRRILRFIMQEEEEMIQWGEAALQALVQNEETRTQAETWEAHLRDYLATAGGVGIEEVTEVKSEDVNPRDHLLTPSPPHPSTPAPRAWTPLEPDWVPRRDSRFESYNYFF